MSLISLWVKRLAERHTLFYRWLIILAGLALQVAILASVIISMKQPAVADITLAPVAGATQTCQIVAVRPFSDAWVSGLQDGMQVKLVDERANENCTTHIQSISVEIVGFPARTININVLPPPTDLVNIALSLILILVFDITGAAIFLHAQKRPIARVTYALFFFTALVSCMFNQRGTALLEINLLGFVASMVIRGLSVTFACLFPYSLSEKPIRQIPVQIYIPLLIGVLLAILSLFMVLAPPPYRFTFIAFTFLYDISCLIITVVVMVRGLRHLKRQERQFARIVMSAILFLLVPLALNLNFIHTGALTLVQTNLLRFLPIPLIVLSLVCVYALFRQQLLGTTSLLSRQAMRVLLWILLASIFIIPSVILINYLSILGVSPIGLDYIDALLLLGSLALFPLLWSKGRDMGDQVFYRDFYEYNRSLRDLSATLTRLRGIQQISTFMLPRLALLLNATETNLLLGTTPQGNSLPNSGSSLEGTADWRVYRSISTLERRKANLPTGGIPEERLMRIANLALTHVHQSSAEPLLLDGMLLLALFDGNRCSGFLCLGPKCNLEPYSKQDHSFLATLASQLSLMEVNSRYLEQAEADAQQLAALNHRVISAQEEERHHLALELHDEALQQAMIVVRQLSDASNMEDVAETMPLARSVVTSLRRTCLELRPPLLDELGLEEAFRWLASQSEELTGNRLRIHVDCIGNWDTRPPASAELALYRVGQEAFSNILKYSGASRATLRLRRSSQGQISLLISDNGRGLQQKHLRAENLGLVGMHERMVAIDGNFQMRTSPGRGVTIRAVCQQKMPKTSSTSHVLSILNTKEPEMNRTIWEEVYS